MNAHTKVEPAATGLTLLRQPFPAHQISKLPKPTKKQTDDVKADFKKGVRCTICGTWHHPDVVHLDYVGHAALTDRLLDADPEWSWEPAGFASDGVPARDPNGGMWIKLTVCGVTRLGYGSADGKTGGDAVKEIIGDALRNAAMRFGAALDLWHKGDLHVTSNSDDGEPPIHHDPVTGEIEHPPEPAAREVLEGKHASKTALQKAMRAVGEKLRTAPDAGAVEALVEEYGEDMAQCRRYLPEWWHGNGTPERRGVSGALEDARARVSAAKPSDFCNEIIDSMKLNDNPVRLAGWVASNEVMIDSLNDVDREFFDTALDGHEVALKLAVLPTAG